ncbi:CDP-diacylglycerol--glycerol-3-phosphate 3-phosphatidyltransferase [Qingshengfaniella alkalisoli]|uniref:CDP-diacylglycerol--glycerol-3-phosphate 3-phosphatidyltransferase n=1 Tax=Qingshengfaniella alkalisoli TaxID=2599296 RepID=A0A5B8I9L3_9RHOB|nr:CDP-diacylglycerol--glycerol-3-phosphate 3-phosphatidyltransferase [Qingshengfaniella alkalisoli]QDY69696.1 CDP-diacylglycerol--glycerol-3-phosphate 3-phosphatidyltransferase [Qingshengfaniella alkalisoli]
MTWTLPNILTVARLIAAPLVLLVFVAVPTPLSYWLALGLFVLASVTDWVDGYIARKYKLESRFGAMLDPIADKAMVMLTIVVVLGASRLSPWLVIPGTVILFREVFVSGLREFLGAQAGLLKVTKLAKWKTTLQMLALTFLLLALGMTEQNDWLFRSMQPQEYQDLLTSGAQNHNPVWRDAMIEQWSWYLGVALFWIAGLLTGITGWDYFSKALPLLKEAGR